MSSHVLANVIRGETIESVHTGHLCVVDGEGHVIAVFGDPMAVTFFRSASKPFQFIPCVTSGAADAFGFDDEEMALAVASHSGEPRHVEIAARMLYKAGFTETDLKCGSHLPYNEAESTRMIGSGEKPTQLHNNCSGKHAAMLAFAKHIDADPSTYEGESNRIQKRVLKCVADFAEMPLESIAIGIDGCAAPNFAIPVSAMAKSFINLIRPKKFHISLQSACERIVSAMIAYPELIGGSGRLDTMLMEAAPGRIISKVGADGVWCCGVLPSDRWPTGLGIALKIADGDDTRARPTVAIEILRQLDVLGEKEMRDISPMLINNRLGEAVGRVEATIQIKEP
jgi:L-asparaginase II